MPKNPSYQLNQDLRPRGEAHSFDAGAFEDAIEFLGVPMVHYRAMACPVGLVNKDDTNTRIHQDHAGCSNGFLYKKMNCCDALFIGNSSTATPNDAGMLDGSTVQVTLPRHYTDGSEAYFSLFDRFYSSDENFLWPHWEIIEHSATGRDRLRWPAVKIENVVDNRGIEYRCGVDFEVQAGQLVWREGGARPGVDPDTDGMRGRVCTVWYLYKPYWYLQRLMHDGRMAQVQDGDERKVTRLPFQGQLVREFIYENVQARDTGTPAPEDTSREMRGPPED